MTEKMSVRIGLGPFVASLINDERSKIVTSSQRKAAKLGMPFGTAMGRLRKLVLFDLLKRFDENFCFKCGEEISLVADLSIEHKKPWESSNNIELFWDLENIAFSHLACNVPHHCGRRKTGPVETSWCAGHQDFVDSSEFYPLPESWNGVRSRCKSCHAAYKKSRRNEFGPLA